jgi:starvation-inducible DNA-binding protein
MTTHAPSQDHHPTLRHEDREAIGAELQDVLVELIDLSLLGKQAHWNLYGPNFRSLHLQLDELVDEWRTASDEVAERAVALGHSPDGQSRTIAERTELAALPSGQISDTDVIDALTERLTESIGRIRTRMDRLEDVDAVTADLLHGVVMALEKQVWMIRVQR